MLFNNFDTKERFLVFKFFFSFDLVFLLAARFVFASVAGQQNKTKTCKVNRLIKSIIQHSEREELVLFNNFDTKERGSWL